jgi:hypothetical protein
VEVPGAVGAEGGAGEKTEAAVIAGATTEERGAGEKAEAAVIAGATTAERGAGSEAEAAVIAGATTAERGAGREAEAAAIAGATTAERETGRKAEAAVVAVATTAGRGAGGAAGAVGAAEAERKPGARDEGAAGAGGAAEAEGKPGTRDAKAEEPVPKGTRGDARGEGAFANTEDKAWAGAVAGAKRNTEVGGPAEAGGEAGEPSGSGNERGRSRETSGRPAGPAGDRRETATADPSKRDTGERKTVSERDKLVATPTGAAEQPEKGRTTGVETPEPAGGVPEPARGAPEAPSSFERGLLPAKSNEFIVPYTIKQQ